MTKIIALLENEGMISPDDVGDRIKRKKASEIERLHAGILDALEESRLKRGTGCNGLLSFFISSSLRGDRCCINPYCSRRFNKLENISRFSALYADKIFFPVHVGSSRHVPDREIIEGAIVALIELRPLIESGIVVPLPDTFALCKCCRKKFSKSTEIAERLTSTLAESKVDLFEVRYRADLSKKDQFVFEVNGPPEYIEGTIILTSKREKWSGLFDLKESFTFSRSLKLSTGFLKNFFKPTEFDLTYQSTQRLTSNSIFLSDSIGEIEYFNAVRDTPQLASGTDILINSLTHSVPLFRDVPVESVLRLRRTDGDAFAKYRIALREALKEYVGNRDYRNIGREIQDDVIRPAVESLEQKERHLKRKSYRKPIIKGAAYSAVIGAGLLTGQLKPEILAALKVLGGLKLLDDAVDAYTSISEASDAVKDDSWYFLLKLKKELA